MAAAALLRTHSLDYAHQNLAHPAAGAAKTDAGPVVEMTCSAADFPQQQAARTEVEETACLAVGMVGFLEEGEERRDRREEEALEEAFRVLLKTQEDQAGRTEGMEEVGHRLCCRPWARVPWDFGASGFVLACPETRSRRLCCQ